MTVASQVKQCMVSLKGAQAELAQFAETAVSDSEQQAFLQAAQTTERIVEDLKMRIGKIESEELQYKGF